MGRLWAVPARRDQGIAAAMTFDRTVTIEPETGRAVLWADTLAGARFRVVIDPKYAIGL